MPKTLEFSRETAKGLEGKIYQILGGASLSASIPGLQLQHELLLCPCRPLSHNGWHCGLWDFAAYFEALPEALELEPRGT